MSRISNLSDEELLILYKEFDKDIYMGELFNRYLPLLYGVCLKYLRDSNKVRKAVMEFLEDMLYTISKYDIKEFQPWFYKAVKNHCAQIIQNERQIVSENMNSLPMEFDTVINLLVENGYGSQNQVLTDCLNKLPEPQRVSLNYFFKEGLSYAEIVDETGYTLKNVKRYIQKGKQNLKVSLEKVEL